MGVNRWGTGWLLVALFLGTHALAASAYAQGGEIAGMITEVKMGRGQVEVRPAGSQEWRRAGPLLAVRPGDAVRATEDASVVILLSGGRGSVKVVAAGSPFVVPAPKAEETKGQKALTLLEATVGFLSTTAKEVPRATLTTRAGAKPPVILSPRNGPVLPGSLTFEWVGSRIARYTVRIVSPQGVVLEKKDLAGARFDYPPEAPPLAPGVRYTFQVLSGNLPTQEAWFEVLDATRARAIRRELTELEQAVPAVSPNTLVTLRTAFLANNGLLHDARATLAAAVARDPDEPTFHLLLGNLYGKVGLPEQAAESHDEAAFLLSGPAR